MFTLAILPMMLTKPKPKPVMVTTPMMMPTQAQQAAIIRMLDAVLSMTARMRRGVSRVSLRKQDRMTAESDPLMAEKMMLRPDIMVAMRMASGAR